MPRTLQITLAQDTDAYRFGGQMARVFVGIMLLVGVIMLVQKIRGKRGNR